MRNSSVVRMESVRRKDPMKRAVNRICARRRCSDAVRMELLRRRATKRKDVPNRPNLLRPPLHPQWKKNNSSPSTVNCRCKSTLKLTSKFHSNFVPFLAFFQTIPAGIFSLSKRITPLVSPGHLFFIKLFNLIGHVGVVRRLRPQVPPGGLG